MSKKLESNLLELSEGALSQGELQQQNEVGFKRQDATVYLWEVKDFYNHSRATYNDNDNCIFFWRANFKKKMKISLLKRTSTFEKNDNSTVSVGTTGIEIRALFKNKLNENELTFVLTFKEDIDNCKNEDIFYIQESNDTGDYRSGYEYILNNLWAIDLGSNSYIKVFNSKKVGFKLEKFETIKLKFTNEMYLNGFDIGADAYVDNVIPIKVYINKAETGNIVPYFPWKDRSQVILLSELLRVADKDKRIIDVKKLLTWDDVFYEPLYNLIKKLVNITINIDLAFQSTKEKPVGGFEGDETVGWFWKKKLDGKDRSAIQGVLYTFIQNTYHAWEQGHDFGEPEQNFPWGKLKILDPKYLISREKINRLQAILCMLSERVYSPYGWAGGGNEFSKFMLPFYFEFKDVNFNVNTTLSWYEIDKLQVITKSLYFILGYELFTPAQIQKYKRIGKVEDYENYVESDTLSERALYGTLNIFLDESIVTPIQHRRFTIVRSKTLLHAEYTGTFTSLGYEKNPWFVCLWKERLGSGDEIETPTVHDVNNIKVLQQIYGDVKLDINGADTKILRGVPLAGGDLTIEDIRIHKGITVGMIEDIDPFPASYANMIARGDNRSGSDTKIVYLNKDCVDFYNEIINNQNKALMGKPTFTLKTSDKINRVDWTEYEKSYVYVDEFYVDIYWREINLSSLYGRIMNGLSINRSQLNNILEYENQPQLKPNLRLHDGLTIFKLREQNVEFGGMPTVLQPQTYSTLPSGVQQDQMVNYWIWVPHYKTMSLLDELDIMFQGGFEFINHPAPNNEYQINVLSDNNKIKYLDLRVFNNGEGEIIINDKFKTKVFFGDPADDTVTQTKIVFKIPEKEV